MPNNGLARLAQRRRLLFTTISLGMSRSSCDLATHQLNKESSWTHYYENVT
ncbi:hypothetical protein VPHD51_0117 [Vibrio phage D51]